METTHPHTHRPIGKTKLSLSKQTLKRLTAVSNSEHALLMLPKVSATQVDFPCLPCTSGTCDPDICGPIG